MKKIVVFASGNGSNFISIYNELLKKAIDGRIVLLISNNSNCGAIKFAKKNSINTKVINEYRYEKKVNEEYEITLKKYKTDLILLAGFMKKIPKNIVSAYNNKIMNIHPSLLPAYGGKGFYGMNVHEAVICSGDKFSGATVHFVNEEYDKGKIIIQEKVRISLDDDAYSLSIKVLEIEHSIYPKAVQLFCENKIRD